MTKIRTKKDAQALVERLIATGKEILLWDEVDSSRLMMVEADTQLNSKCSLTFIDGVTGMIDIYTAYKSEAIEAIFRNRKNVNSLNNLESL